MSINIQQMILEAQRMANRNKEMVELSNSLLVEAESTNRTLEAMRQFQDDMDSLNNLARNKSNSDMINRINQQNPSIRETRNENRELKATLEDHQRVLELVMHKYREHTQQKIYESHVNYKELYNENLLEVIRKQADKIREMAAVMQKAASADDEAIYKEIEWNNKLKTENQSLRELLQISNDFGSSGIAIKNSIIDSLQNIPSGSSNNSTCRSCEDKAIQTELSNQQSISSVLSTPSKSIEDENDKSVIENEIIFDEEDFNTLKKVKLENGNSSTCEDGKNNSNNNSPIKTSLTTTTNNDISTNEENFIENKSNNVNNIKSNENNIEEIADISKLNLTNGTVESDNENDLQINNDILNNSIEKQDNNNKTVS